MKDPVTGEEIDDYRELEERAGAAGSFAWVFILGLLAVLWLAAH